MDGLSRHDALFHRLLFDRGVRDRVRAGDWSFAGDDAPAFTGIDLGELDKLALAVRDGLLRGSLGGLGIGPAFVETIAALGGSAEQVAERFLAATGGRRIDGTGRRAGISVLEAFHGWAADELALQPPAACRAQHELAAALLAALARTPRAGFLVEWPLVHAGPCGWYCVLDAMQPLARPADPPQQPVVYLAVGGRYASGRLSADLAAVVLEGADHPPDWARARVAALDPATLAAVRAALAARGLS